MKLGHITICCSKKDNLHFIVVYTSSHDIKNATITVTLLIVCDCNNRHVKCECLNHDCHWHLWYTDIASVMILYFGENSYRYCVIEACTTISYYKSMAVQKQGGE